MGLEAITGFSVSLVRLKAPVALPQEQQQQEGDDDPQHQRKQQKRVFAAVNRLPVLSEVSGGKLPAVNVQRSIFTRVSLGMNDELVSFFDASERSTRFGIA